MGDCIAGPCKLVRQELGIKLEFEAFEEYYRPVHIEHLVMVGVPCRCSDTPL
jgi:hypothetical protein